jgi:hypothetical protein
VPGEDVAELTEEPTNLATALLRLDGAGLSEALGVDPQFDGLPYQGRSVSEGTASTFTDSLLLGDNLASG